ncbi:Odorant receptor 94b [Anopheles darlingi]|uniref:Odorant receptor 94b n=2 Tax=Anopheles darlingi TaxID=43151 RepID=W5J7F2_ANODA|nr:Odorant receptor 94b [Anopheles darlingi]
MKFWNEYLKRKEALFRRQHQTPLDLFESANRRLAKWFYFCGAERITANYTRYNARLIFLVVDLILYLLVNCYSMAVVWGSIMDVVFNFVTLGIAIQGLAKILAFTSDGLWVLHCYNIDRFKALPRYSEVTDSLYHTATLCKVFIDILLVLFSMVAVIIYSYAIMMPILKGKLELAFGFQLPFINHTTVIGFCVNWLYQAVQVIEATVGLAACDICLVFLIVNATGQMDLIIIYLRRLTELVDTDIDGENEAKIADLVHEIVIKHLEHTK